MKKEEEEIMGEWFIDKGETVKSQRADDTASEAMTENAKGFP